MNPNLLDLKKSASMELMRFANELKEKGVEVVNLAGGEPDFNTPQRICQALYDEIKIGNTHYSVGTGLKELRERIVRKSNEDNGIVANPDQVIMTPGSKFAIFLSLMTLIQPGDEVIVFNPSWVSYEPMIKACGGKPICIELSMEDDYEINEDVLLSNMSNRVRAIIINYPNNPTGKVLSEASCDTLKKVMSLYDVYLVSDEVYEKIVYEPFKHVSPGSWCEFANRIITISGFSKSYAMTGWRIGYLIAPLDVVNVMSKLYAHSITGLSPFIQKAAMVALECDDDVERMVAIYRRRRDYFVSEINDIPGFTCKYPEGAFYAWVKIDCKCDSHSFAKALLDKTGIVGVPGQAYGATEKPFIRFSFANSESSLEQAIERLKNAFADGIPF